MFRKIVAAVDNDAERANHVVAAAGELATALRAEVLVVHVRELERPASLLGAGRPGVAIPPSMPLESEDNARRVVDSALATLRDQGVRADGRMHPGSADGSTAKDLIDIAATFGADLIVVGDRGGRVTDVLLGGVSHKIVQLAACPVLLVR